MKKDIDNVLRAFGSLSEETWCSLPTVVQNWYLDTFSKRCIEEIRLRRLDVVNELFEEFTKRDY